MKSKKRYCEKDYYDYEDDHGLFYATLGLLLVSLFCVVAFWVCDYVGLLVVPSEESSRPVVEPVPVLLPDFDKVEEIYTEEYQNLLKENPPRSTMSTYKTI